MKAKNNTDSVNINLRAYPKIVRDAVKAAGFQPEQRQCFWNSQHLCLFQSLLRLEYWEGVVRTAAGNIVCHAWCQDEQGNVVDLTHVGSVVLEGYTVIKADLKRRIKETDYCTPHNIDKLNQMRYEHMRKEVPA